MKDNKGFTLIELLAVIVILAILMLVAIPSVSTYITSSRKEAFIDNAKSTVKGVLNDVNSGKYSMYDTDTTYYIPASCVKKESGGQSAFGGDWVHQFIVVTYDGDGFNYYYTGVDSTKMGIYLTYSNLLAENLIKSSIQDLPINITVGDRDKIVYYSDACDGTYTETYNVRHLIRDKNIYDEDTVTEYFQLHGFCNFHGKNGVIDGDGCLDFNGQKYINTGLKLFNQRNAKKDFEISFNLERMVPADQDAGVTQATLVAAKLEKNNFPGFVFRFATDKLEFTERIGNEKLIINKAIGEVKSVKIVRKDEVLYYAINGEQLSKFQDVHSFKDYFDSTLFIGAAEDGNGNPFRHVHASVSNLVVRLGDINFIGIDSNMSTVFSLPGQCVFNGKNANVTGSGCSQYSNKTYVDTGIKLYSQENIKKDFMISFNIVNYSPTAQEVDGDSQNTLLSAKQETGLQQGLAVRKIDNDYEITQKLNKTKATAKKNYKNITNIKIYRKKGIVYYMINDGSLYKLQDKIDGAVPFDETLWFGAAKDANGNPFRHIKGTISDIEVKMQK